MCPVRSRQMRTAPRAKFNSPPHYIPRSGCAYCGSCTTYELYLLPGVALRAFDLALIRCRLPEGSWALLGAVRR